MVSSVTFKEPCFSLVSKPTGNFVHLNVFPKGLDSQELEVNDETFLKTTREPVETCLWSLKILRFTLILVLLRNFPRPLNLTMVQFDHGTVFIQTMSMTLRPHHMLYIRLRSQFPFLWWQHVLARFMHFLQMCTGKTKLINQKKSGRRRMERGGLPRVSCLSTPSSLTPATQTTVPVNKVRAWLCGFFLNTDWLIEF